MTKLVPKGISRVRLRTLPEEFLEKLSDNTFKKFQEIYSGIPSGSSKQTFSAIRSPIPPGISLAISVVLLGLNSNIFLQIHPELFSKNSFSNLHGSSTEFF